MVSLAAKCRALSETDLNKKYNLRSALSMVAWVQQACQRIETKLTQKTKTVGGVADRSRLAEKVANFVKIREKNAIKIEKNTKTDEPSRKKRNITKHRDKSRNNEEKSQNITTKFEKMLKNHEQS